MMKLTKTILASSIAAMATPFAPALAQSADDGAATEKITVTARRQAERLVDVPASVTVITGQTLARTGVDRVAGIVQYTPGVSIVTGTAEAGDTQVNIRGINGARDAESSVAVVIDGILKTNTAQLNQNQGVLRQVEVLKGPQGAIYGRNAAAGAVVMSTILPGDTLRGGITTSLANHGTVQGTAYIATPLSENVGLVLSGTYSKTDGFYRNDFLNDNVVDNLKNEGLDGRVFFRLGPDTTLDFKTHFDKVSGASIAFNASFHLPNFAAFNPAFYENVNEHPYHFYGNIRPTNDQRTSDASIKIDHDFGATRLTGWMLYSDITQNLTADGTSADFARYISPALGAPSNATNLAVQNACFTSTAALTGYPVNAPGGVGAIPVPFLFAPSNGSTFGPYSPTTCDGTQFQMRNQRDLSGELRLASTGDGPLSWQVGSYYLHIDRSTAVSLGADLGQGVIKQPYNPPDSSNPTSQLYADNFKTNVVALFGSAEYSLDKFYKIGVAARYDQEARSVSSRVPNVADPITGAKINPGLPATGSIPDQSETYKQLQPKFTLSYRPDAATNIYGNWGVGFKPGGFNNQGSAAVVNANFNDGVTPGTINANVLITDQYRKETSSAFEAGVKGSLLGGALTYDLAAYYTRVTDMQFFEFFVGSFGLLRVVSNIDQVDVKGVELNLNARPAAGWTLYSGLNITDSSIKKNTSRPYTVGNESPYTAKYTVNLGAQFEKSLGEKRNGFVRADYRLTGPTWFHTVQNQERPTIFSGLIPISAVNFLPASTGTARYDVAQRKAFGLLDLRAGIQGEMWGVSVFSKNALDKKYANEVIPAIEFGGSFISPGAGRLVGVEGSIKF
jgi:iron complex outermembrane receptor protein